jgi:YggT family protein
MGMDNVIAFVNWCFTIYTLFLLIHILFSWFQLPYNPVLARVRTVLYDACQPYLNIFRGIIPPIGAIDISPILGLILLGVMNRIVVALLSAIG